MAKHLFELDHKSIEQVLARGREVIELEAHALNSLAQSLDDQFVIACHSILHCNGRLVLSGMGKSGHIARKLAATFSATGTPAIFVHPAEAAHGDLGMLAKGDVLLVLSNSGNTLELRPLLNHARLLGICVIGIASRNSSLVMDMADIRLALPQIREACAVDITPTTSTTLQLALGDALALSVMDLRGISRDHLRILHPGGAIGFRLAPVSQIMHGAERLPIVSRNTSIPDVISTMTTGGFGIAGVVDDKGALIGVITDGDLRRHFQELSNATASDIMTSAPKTVPMTMPVEDALLTLNGMKITAMFVLDELGLGCPIGIVHIHDFLRVGLN